MRRILLAGFGGQGILFAGKFLAYLGLYQDKAVTWLPSYGPEMRGGTANCSVVLADESIGSPIVSTPDILICMNLPSLEKFEKAAAAGGQIFLDSSLIDQPVTRQDLRAYGVPATRMASEAGMGQLANMILLGKVLKETELCDLDTAAQVLEKVIPERKQALLDANLKALRLGYAR